MFGNDKDWSLKRRKTNWCTSSTSSWRTREAAQTAPLCTSVQLQRSEKQEPTPVELSVIARRASFNFPQPPADLSKRLIFPEILIAQNNWEMPNHINIFWPKSYKETKGGKHLTTEEKSLKTACSKMPRGNKLQSHESASGGMPFSGTGHNSGATLAKWSNDTQWDIRGYITQNGNHNSPRNDLQVTILVSSLCTKSGFIINQTEHVSVHCTFYWCVTCSTTRSHERKSVFFCFRYFHQSSSWTGRLKFSAQAPRSPN